MATKAVRDAEQEKSKETSEREKKPRHERPTFHFFIKAADMMYTSIDAIRPHVETKVCELHMKLTKELGTSQCTSSCPAKEEPKNSCTVCYGWRTEVLECHTKNKNHTKNKKDFIHWTNADFKKVSKDPWEVAKLFMHKMPLTGKLIDSNTVDISGIVNLVINCKIFLRKKDKCERPDCKIDCSTCQRKPGAIKTLQKFLKLKNDILSHGKDIEIDERTSRDCYDTCYSFLQLFDSSESVSSEHKKFVTTAMQNIEKIKTRKYTILESNKIINKTSIQLSFKTQATANQPADKYGILLFHSMEDEKSELMRKLTELFQLKNWSYKSINLYVKNNIYKDFKKAREKASCVLFVLTPNLVNDTDLDFENCSSTAIKSSGKTPVFVIQNKEDKMRSEGLEAFESRRIIKYSKDSTFWKSQLVENIHKCIQLECTSIPDSHPFEHRYRHRQLSSPESFGPSGDRDSGFGFSSLDSFSPLVSRDHGTTAHLSRDRGSVSYATDEPSRDTSFSNSSAQAISDTTSVLPTVDSSSYGIEETAEPSGDNGSISDPNAEPSVDTGFISSQT